MRRFVWLLPFLLAATTGCGDPLVGPARGSFTSSLTFEEPTNPTEAAACCPTSGACGSNGCTGTCGGSSCCPASHCDKNGRHK